jgi:hypothetical protein
MSARSSAPCGHARRCLGTGGRRRDGGGQAPQLTPCRASTPLRCAIPSTSRRPIRTAARRCSTAPTWSRTSSGRGRSDQMEMVNRRARQQFARSRHSPPPSRDRRQGGVSLPPSPPACARAACRSSAVPGQRPARWRPACSASSRWWPCSGEPLNPCISAGCASATFQGVAFASRHPLSVGGLDKKPTSSCTVLGKLLNILSSLSSPFGSRKREGALSCQNDGSRTRDTRMDQGTGRGAHHVVERRNLRQRNRSAAERYEKCSHRQSLPPPTAEAPPIVSDSIG